MLLLSLVPWISFSVRLIGKLGREAVASDARVQLGEAVEDSV
jgi:hypothetical protein